MSDLPSNWGIKSPDQLLGSLRVAENGGDVTECADALEWMLRSGRLVDRKAIDREWVYGWIEAGFSEFLVGAKEHDEAYAKLDELRAALGEKT